MIPNKLVLSLIRRHFENNEEGFKESCREIEKIFFENNQEELARYIQAEMNECPTFVPQEISNKVVINKKIITDKENDFGDIMIMSLRYALGRRTYVTDEVPSFIKQNAEFINERICIVMLRDITRYIEDRKNGIEKDDDCDYNSWLSLQTWLFNIAKEKKFNIVDYMRR